MSGRNYSRKDSVTGSDLNFIWDAENSYWAFASFTTCLAYYQANLTFPDTGRPEPDTQYSSPNGDGQTIVVTDNNKDTHLIITPTVSLATLSITLPANTNARDKQLLIVNTTQQVTDLTINLNGAVGATGSLTSLGADDYFTLKYDQINNIWYRIG